MENTSNININYSYSRQNSNRTIKKSLFAIVKYKVIKNNREKRL